MTDFTELVLVDMTAGIAEVTLNRPHAMNALNSALRKRIAEVFEYLAEDESTEVVIFTGAGRAFCAGLDLKELGGEVATEYPDASGDMLRALQDFPHPIIGAVNGFAVTGGFELALMCDMLIASTNARFADTHARVGVVPGWGLSQRLPRLIGINRAKELSLTGNYLSAEKACDWGLVNRVVAPDALLAEARALATDITSTDRATRSTIKRIIDEGWQTDLATGLEIEREASREQGFSMDAVRARRKDIQARARAQSA